MLVCHDWGGSFIEIAHAIDALTLPPAPAKDGMRAVPAFHVVCPSIPGFGYSDASNDENFGVRQTAEVFLALMHKLGYNRFVAFGSRW